MKKVNWYIGTTLLGSSLMFGLGNMVVHAGDDGWFGARNKPLNASYKEECGACHMAYPPSLLPEKSWMKIMSGLDNHFDENAELDAESNQKILAYLKKNALGKGGFRDSYRMLRNLRNRSPLRITELPYFIAKHDEVPKRMVKGNPKVGSFSRCEACHRNAAKGDFDEDNVRIPGYGGWE